MDRDAREVQASVTAVSSETEVCLGCAQGPSGTIESLCGQIILLTVPLIEAEVGPERRNRELESLNETLRRRVAELEAQNRDLDSFAHTVAHDLRGPICNFGGYAEFLLDAYTTLPDEKVRTCLETIRFQAHKMEAIVDELLLLAGARQEKVEMGPLDMASIVDKTLHRLAYMIERHEARLVSAPTWPTAFGYDPWIEEVWVNYISNAIKYGGRPPYVELGATPGDDSVRFWVRDNGCGLTPEEQVPLFTPFTRLNQVRTTGYGLGLSIVRHIVEKLGGQVGVKSEKGQGSIFSFTLPVENGAFQPGVS